MDKAVGQAVILNVDDHAPARYARTRILRQAGFAVHDAGTGADALRLLDEVHPDLVLLDVHLPDISGIEVCRRIKNQEESANVIVLQISASAISAPQATTALNTGADTYLIEPIDPDVLVATVRAFLRLRAAERGLAEANRQLLAKNRELEDVNKALRRSNEDLEHFAYVASHDLQEPLRNITTFVELLQARASTRFDESERQMFRIVVESALRMSMLIRDVLAYAGVGRETRQLTPTNLADPLGQALQNLSQGIADSAAIVETQDLPAVLGDSMQLTRVFQNLIGNSIKYRTPDVPLRIRISAEAHEPGVWLIRVSDNGIGIGKQYHRKIFQPFKRLHGYEIVGSGIGLALCLRIIEAHEGHIWVESNEGTGSTFLFTLRAAEVGAATAGGKTPPPGARGV